MRGTSQGLSGSDGTRLKFDDGEAACEADLFKRGSSDPRQAKRREPRVCEIGREG